MSSPRVLIVTKPNDLHADCVAWAIGRLGGRADLWIPGETTAGFAIGGGASGFVSGGPPAPIEDYRSVWFRRRPPLRVPEGLCAEDRIFLRRELDYFQRGIGMALASGAMAANSPATDFHAELKAPQLLAAEAAGLQIPPTLLGNDPDDVRAFIAAAPGRVIYKSHSPAVWRAGEAISAVYTSLVGSADLDGIDADSFNPGIFQHFIPKAFELRIGIFGRTCVAARIDQPHGVDSRIQQEGMTVSPYALPPVLEARLLAMMAALGLVMGSVDMIVTPEGEHVFLEVNCQGQFLWTDERDDGIDMLDACARFLASGDPAFRRTRAGGARLTWRDYLRSARAEALVAAVARAAGEGHPPEPWFIEERAAAAG